MKGRIQNRVRVAVITLCLVFLAGTAIGLHRISQVNRAVTTVNQVLVPVSRVLAQLQVDSEVLHREAMKGLAFSRWGDAHFKPRPLPDWILGLIDREIAQLDSLLSVRAGLPAWREWLESFETHTADLKARSNELHGLLSSGRMAEARKAYPVWWQGLESWRSLVESGGNTFERSLRIGAEEAETRAHELRLALQILLFAVFALSLLVIWFGERALRPLAHLTGLAREISSRGFAKRDKTEIFAASIGQNDEVNELTREFHRMATTVLEREKTVETQKRRLEDQNRELEKVQEMRKRLEASERLAALGRMSAQVAHEVRNPLHSIGLEAELALEIAARENASPSVKQALQSILESVERLERVSGNYLSLSRVPSVDKTWADLGSILESVLATYSAQIVEAGAGVDWERAKGARLKVLADPGLLEQAVGNLLRNSLQAGSRSIRFLLSNDPRGRVVLRIEDDGEGIPAEIRTKLFTPFLTTKSEGTGLGLSFVKKTLEEHGGEVEWIESPRGTIFECRLPSPPTAPPPLAASAAEGRV